MNRLSTYVRRLGAVAIVVSAVTALPVGVADAHPLGNFTTNTALALTVGRDRVDGRYIVDLAEIPALQVRQGLGASTGTVPADVGMKWAANECAARSEKLGLMVEGRTVAWTVQGSHVTFPAGQAGLSTLRLECNLVSSVSAFTVGSAISIKDSNFADRLGWREITAGSAGVTIQTDLGSQSRSEFLTSYPKNAIGAPSNVRAGSIAVKALTGGTALGTATAPTSASSTTKSAVRVTRGNNALTRRFQSLVARNHLSPMFAFGAVLLAIVLGGFHALAPGHGKSLMAAYVLGRRGGRRELITIGGTVALTHTIGVILLGAAALASTSWSPDRTLRWTGVGSGLLVVAVGVGLLRDRLRSYRADGGRRSWLDTVEATPLVDRSLLAPAEHGDHGHGDHRHDEHGHAHGNDHAHGDHGPDHSRGDHGHAHGEHGHDDHDGHEHEGHGHGHAHNAPAKRSLRARFGRQAIEDARLDPNLVVTTHAHGGLNHSHVLPKPGALVSRRQLVSMGLAGGLVPSPSALVVLLAAVALGRIWFGVLLVVAYGIGLALTLMGAGVALAYFEGRLRRWTTGSGRAAAIAPVISVLPLASAFVLIGGGALLVSRALAGI